MSVFEQTKEEDKLYQDEWCFIKKDEFPVSEGHLLIISNKIKKDFFDLSILEKVKILFCIDKAKNIIENELGLKPDGYNIGMNCGEAAGQTVMHFHCHLIPRYKGDMENPRGGVRHCIQGKGNY